MTHIREFILFGVLAVLIGILVLWLSPVGTIQILALASAYALIALGLNVQWGYGGLFNFGVMGFLMLGGFGVVFASYPINESFWGSDGPMLLGRAAIAAAFGAVIIIAAAKSEKFGLGKRSRMFALVVAWAVAYIVYRSQIDPAVAYIEGEVEQGFVGGLGLHAIFGWALGGVFAGAVAYVIGKICLGLRTDYLAIATIGIAEIIRALIKNMDWLTRGTLTVSPVPWPVPTQADLAASGLEDLSLITARSMYLVLTLLVIVVIFLLLQRAYYGPWGRMMRAIRDNHIAAGSMGKDVKRRQIEIFVLGAALMGIGGSILTTYVQIFDPGGYQPINHTFIVWVMIIVGGAGNNLGALFGGVFIYIVWTISDPIAEFIFRNLSEFSDGMGWGAIPDVQSRALQMRVFVLGLVITIALRYAPQGLIPERIGGAKAED
ncbi:branched-chain amino acid ABC transporter permease [Cucumibacter marinus]|uniref:branched-chain amino acid ABC transporter permease n=1 Tax=Cucumibacter marinus TaxID=1121252 RepID=UPI0003F5E027|nr:branched-chain amino acid ABC transporter permease [Cucumibacter marinus]